MKLLFLRLGGIGSTYLYIWDDRARMQGSHITNLLFATRGCGQIDLAVYVTKGCMHAADRKEELFKLLYK
jgi:hypothetical protein